MKFDSASSWTGPSVSISASGRSGLGSREAGDQLVDSRGGEVVGFPAVLARSDVGVGYHQDGLADVVEEDHPVVEGERQVGQPPVVRRGVGQCSV